ncbi:hypothetical protein IWX49DRAFT_268484 [Phyllosticta citricarpa]|uniref:F-box domain-containing protein n=1 Tax=Phyllosticta citricarpa TaxID=55181 RepID=A0ABR1LP32_9PEZI
MASNAVAVVAPRSRLLSLPTELLMEIIEYLSPETFINFAFAAYSSLQQRLIVPPMTWRIYAPLCRNLPAPRLPRRRENDATTTSTTSPPSSSSATTSSSHSPAAPPTGTSTAPTSSNLLIFAAWPLPTELTLQVLRRLRPRELMRFVLGHYRLLPGLLPRITPQTNIQLTRAWAQVEIARRLAEAQAEGEEGARALLYGGRGRRRMVERERERDGRTRAWSV